MRASFIAEDTAVQNVVDSGIY